MASSDHRQTHIAQPEADDEQWALLEHRGDTVNEQLHEKQDGDVKREVGSIPDTNEEWLSADDMEKLLRWCRCDSVFKGGVKDIVKKAAKRLQSAQATEKYFWSWRSAWNDTFAHDAGWEGIRPYVVTATLLLHTVFHVLEALSSLTHFNALHALLVGLKHFTTVMTHASVLSIATRFLSIVAVKASLVVKSCYVGIITFLVLTCTFILMATYFICIHKVGTGITLLQETRREEDFPWLLQLLADTWRVYVLTAAVLMCATLVVGMVIDFHVLTSASFLHTLVMAQYRRLASHRRLKGRAE